MARTTNVLVAELLGADYDGKRNLAPFVATAGSVIDRAVVCATAKSKVISTADLELMERWLAAHFYTKSDRVYQNSSTEGASAGYVLDPENPEPYKAGALALDYTGCLAAILNGKRAGMAWLGKPPSEQIPIWDRD